MPNYQKDDLRETNHALKAILIIESDADIASRLIQIIREKTHYHTLLASTGTRALRTIQGVKPDLLILNHQLIDTDGAALYHYLRTSEDLQNIPILVIHSDSYFSYDKTRSQHIIAVKEPLRVDGLLHTIHELLA
jgi:DNA-binding response OmpR family regulator